MQATINGEDRTFLARAVIDATGSWVTPNPIGADGLFAPGERSQCRQDRLWHSRCVGQRSHRFAGKHVAVVGGGHSAINAILELMDLHEAHPATQITWMLRKANVAATYGGLENDELPGRGLLGIRIKQLVEAGAVEVVTPFFTTRIERAGEQVRLIGDTPTGERAITVDQVIGATGSRPDLSFLREVRLDLHNSVEAPSAIAPLIDPNFHSCGSVPPHGEKELRHPEPGFYMVGMKSYGRAPTFLLATGYEQVRSVVAGVGGRLGSGCRCAAGIARNRCLWRASRGRCQWVGAGRCLLWHSSSQNTALISLDLETIPALPRCPATCHACSRSTLSRSRSRTTLPCREPMAAGSCCGVDGCCTDTAAVAADACCTPETKAELAGQPVAAGCCG